MVEKLAVMPFGFLSQGLLFNEALNEDGGDFVDVGAGEKNRTGLLRSAGSFLGR
jgi:hypothetical protein